MRVAVLSYLTRSCSGKLLDLRSQIVCGHATILKPPIPFHTITIDFTIRLPDTGTYNAIKSVTDKFTKRNMAIPGRDTWSALQWADVLLPRLAEGDYGPPKRIISDRDPNSLLRCGKRSSSNRALNCDTRPHTIHRLTASQNGSPDNRTLPAHDSTLPAYHTIVKQSLEILTLGKTVRSGQLSLYIKGDN
jgi:hypothetical protein